MGNIRVIWCGAGGGGFFGGMLGGTVLVNLGRVMGESCVGRVEFVLSTSFVK